MSVQMWPLGFEAVFCACLAQYASPHLNLIALSVLVQQQIFSVLTDILDITDTRSDKADFCH